MENPTTALTRVLLVEDSPPLCARIVVDVRAFGRFEVVATVDTEHDAVEAITGLCPDIVVTDLGLRQGSGLEVIRYALRSDCFPLPCVLVLTNYDLPAYRSRCMDLGASGFFDKSSEYQSFLRALGEAPNPRGT